MNSETERAIVDRGVDEDRDSLLRECRALCETLLETDERAPVALDSLLELKTAIAELGETNKVIRENARQVYGIADNLAGSAEQGFDLSRKVQSNVVALADELGSSLAETDRLLEESKRISDILTIMSDIATTTNVLSINASIVAARAGLKGKEFDVVAKEVRKLSVSTEQSLADIATLVKDIQSKILNVSNMLKNVSSGILNEKDAMLSVAGALQGVTLAVEVIRSASDASGTKAEESLRGFERTMRNIDAATEACRTAAPRGRIEELVERIRKRTEPSVH